MKRWLLLFLSVFALGAPAGAEAKLTDLEIWITPAVTEAAGIPDDWSGYRIIRDKLGINLKIVLLPGTPQDADTKINTAAAANHLPDLFHTNQTVWDKLVKQGLLAPVDGLLAKMPVRTKSHYRDPIRNKIVLRKGKMMGLPDPGQIPRTEGLVIRKDWLDKLGLKVPVTTEDFLNVMKAFTTQDPDGDGQNNTYGFGGFIEINSMIEMGLGRRFDPIMGAFGVPGVWNTDPKTFGLQVRRPEYFEALSFVNQMVKARVLDPEWASLKKDEFRIRWKQGRYGIIREQFSALASSSNYPPFDKNFPNGEWIPIAPPKGPRGDSAQGMDLADLRIHSVSKKAIDQGKGDALARLLEWMSSDEGYLLLGFGEKGVNYNLDAEGNVTIDGLPDPTKAYSKPAGQPMTQLRNLVFVNSDFELRPRYLAHKTINGRTIDPLKILAAFGKYPYYDAVAAQVVPAPATAADLQRYYNENVVKFALGVQPLNQVNWDKFLAGLDSLGARDWERSAKAAAADAGLLD